MIGPGKHHDKWIQTRKAWLKANPPNHQGYYTCYLCKKWIPAAEITLDHIVARSKDPSLRYEFSNLAPACWTCNQQKGSRRVKSQSALNPQRDDLEGLW